MSTLERLEAEREVLDQQIAEERARLQRERRELVHNNYGVKVVCRSCQGDAYYDRDPCDACEGRGWHIYCKLTPGWLEHSPQERDEILGWFHCFDAC